MVGTTIDVPDLISSSLFVLCDEFVNFSLNFAWLQVRDELEQLLDDDDDMADLYLSRKLAGPSSPGSGVASWFPGSPTIGSRISRASRASIATIRGDENDVEELEMLLEVISVSYLKPFMLQFLV